LNVKSFQTNSLVALVAASAERRVSMYPRTLKKGCELVRIIKRNVVQSMRRWFDAFVHLWLQGIWTRHQALCHPCYLRENL